MPLKNYTSTVPIDRTLRRIEAALVQAGATNISREYSADHEIQAMRFAIADPTVGKVIEIRLPVDAEAAYAVMVQEAKRERPRTRPKTMDKLRDQAGRTAWRLMEDWTRVQLSLIEMRQVELLQVFLPYVWNGRTTFYAQLKAGSFKMLPQHEEAR